MEERDWDIEEKERREKRIDIEEKKKKRRV